MSVVGLAGQPKDNYIRIGDYITLKYLKHQCYLSAEGLLVEDIYVSPGLKFFEEHLFQIYVQRQYSATNELEEFSDNIASDINALRDQGTINHMEALIKGKENEGILNRNVMKSKTGNLVSFGDTIQLLHVKSGKFITVQPNDLARDERENMRVSLSADGSVMSWLKILPRYKINREGEYITNNTEVMMKVSERSTEFLHCADRPPPRGKLHEVNSSLESPTPWRMTVFQRVTELQQKPLLLTGQLVYIRDPESQCMLAPIPRPAKLEDIKATNIVRAGSHAGEGAVFPGVGVGSSKWKLGSESGIKKVESEDAKTSDNEDDDDANHDEDDKDGDDSASTGGDSIASVDEFIQDNGDLVLKPMEEGDIDSDAVWVMESKNISRGGSLDVRTERVHFRHCNTGKYLSVRLKEGTQDTFIPVLEDTPSEKATLFIIHLLYSTDDKLLNARAVQLRHAHLGVSLERGKYHGSQKVYICGMTRSKSKAVSIILNRYEQIEKPSPTGSSSFMKNPGRSAEETFDIYFGLAVLYHFNKFVKATNIPQFSVTEVNTIWPRIDPADRGLFSVLLARTALFVRGYPVSTTSVTPAEIAKFKADKLVIARRQKMAREQGMLQGLLCMLKMLKPVSDLVAADATQSNNRLVKSGFVDMGKEVLGECLSLIYDLVKNNLANQLYIADHLLVILAHVSTDKTAAKVAQELLSSNRELQETKIGKREITIFADKMRDVPLNSMYLQLLQTCCSCLGQGLPKNQDVVLSIVFQRYRDVLINIHAHTGSVGFADWGMGTPVYDLFIAPYLKKGCIRGEQLISDGLVPIGMSWSSKASRISAMKLFGKQEVPMWDVYRQLSTANSVGGSSRKGVDGSFESGSVAFNGAFANSRNPDFGRGPPPPSRKESMVLQTMDYKRSVGEFCIAQIELAGEMCLGRNYLVINHMEQLYSYEALVTMLKGSPHDALKRAAVYLLTTLYVDRDPQSIVQLPRLTRTISEVSRANSMDLVCVQGKAAYQFALLQGSIAQHLSDITRRPFQNHTYQLMKLLQKLVQFSFYGKVDLLKNTINLLVGCLQRGNCDLNEEEEMSSFAVSMHKLSAKMNPMQSSKKNKKPPTITAGTSAVDLIKSISSGALLEDSGFADDDEEEGGGGGNGKKKRTKKHTNDALLQFLEGMPAQVYMLILVGVTGAGSIYQTAVSSEDIYYYGIDILIFAIFIVEFLLHFVAHMLERQSFVGFITNKHNALDLLPILLFIIAAGVNIFLLRFTKFFRLSRLLLIYELYAQHQEELRALEIAKKESVVTWVEPDRYFKTSDTSVFTIVRIVQILSLIQKNIEDQNLSLVLKAFHRWSTDSKSSADSAPAVFQKIALHGSDLAISNDDFDDIYMDLLMYSHADLVQATLSLLMVHHSSQRILLDNVCKLQLIITDAGEKQYNAMERVLHTLRRDAETHEIWGKLQTPDQCQTNEDMHRYLSELREACRKSRDILKFDESHEPVTSTQNILRNLGCFDLCMKILSLISSIDKDDSLNEAHQNTRKLALACNRLLYWFILENTANQSLAYTQLRFFIKTIDEKIESHKVIEAIFRNNLTLMESVPKKYISDFIELICTQGRFPQYLSLMASIIKVGEKNVIENQYEVIKLMSSPENQKKVLQYFVPVTHIDYAKKLRLMSHHLQQKDVSVGELPPDLAYHLELMGLLSSCTVGRSGMTTIEAKVQSMFFFVDVVEAILDPQCLMLAKIRMGSFLYNAMLDVETLLPAVKDADCIWKLLISTQDVFAFAKDDLRQIEKNGWEAHSSSRQRVEYMLVCAMVVSSYFSAYYDYTIFKPDIGQVALGVDRITIREPQAQNIIKSLYMKISALYEMLSPMLAPEHHQILYDALVALNDAAKEKLVGNVENIHESFLKAAEDYSQISERAGKSYEDFVETLTQSSVVSEMVEGQIQGFISKIEKIPWKASSEQSDVRFEPLVEKLVAHIRSTVRIVAHGDEYQKHVSVEATKTGIWILRIFRTMVENRWGMTIYERDDDGGEEQDDAVTDLMEVYNASGMTEMCLDLIAKGIDIPLQAEALKLLVAMLFKEGGALAFQRSIYAHLSKPGSEMFFRNVRSILNTLMSWHKWNGVIVLEPDDDVDLPDEIILVRCLQLMCEGHYQPNQDILREQPSNQVSINLLDDFVLYLQALDNIKCRSSTQAEMAVSATILEVIQGPCEGNQDYFALNTELIETLNRKIRQHPVNDCDDTEEISLKKSYIDIFQALLEGQGRKTLVYERMLSVIHIDVIQVLCRKSDDQGGADSGGAGGGGGDDEESDESVELRTESLVLMQMLTDFRPSLKKELGMDDDVSKIVGGSVACIEVVWRGELQRRFFHVPDICLALAKTTKDHFIATVKRASPEDKLYGLLEAAKDMYREIKHQQMLADLGMERFFSRTNLTRASWITFVIVLVINLLFLLFYVTEDVKCPSTDYVDDSISDYGGDSGCTDIVIKYSSVSLSITVLNGLMVFLAASVLVQHLVVRMPLSFQTYTEEEMHWARASLYTAMDPLAAYYVLYLFVAIYGYFRHEALTFLLLDFVSKSPTSQAVLRAVYNPRKQIIMTLVLSMIVIYIFAMFQFFFFNEGEDFSEANSAITLWNTFKFLLRWGLPEGTLENWMEPTIYTYRVINDLMFFISILLVLNILKGITIDTFVELRKELEDRLADTTEKCFICGIDKNTFNRTLDRDAFRVHTKVDQNLWNYIYFIIYIWEQDKDDDDGLESYVRKCIDDADLIWFPMNKAIRLTEHQEKGDVTSLKYKFRSDLTQSETILQSKMTMFKDQLNRTIARVEKALEYEDRPEGGLRKTGSRYGSRGTPSAAKRAATQGGDGAGIAGGGGAGSVVSAFGGSHGTPVHGRGPGGSISAPSRISFASTVSDLPIDSPMAGSGSGRHPLRANEHIGQAMLNARKAVDAAAGAIPQQQQHASQHHHQHQHHQLRQHGHGHASALDADNMGLLHVKIASIAGLDLAHESMVGNIVVRIVSNFSPQKLIRPLPGLETMSKYEDILDRSQPYQSVKLSSPPRARSSTHSRQSIFKSAFSKTRASFLKHLDEQGASALNSLSIVKFDTLMQEATLVHQGPLPPEDLSKYSIKVQVLYGMDEQHMQFIGGANVPIVELLDKAHSGLVLEVPFTQRKSTLTYNADGRRASSRTGSAPHPVGQVVGGLHDLNVRTIENENVHDGPDSSSPSVTAAAAGVGAEDSMTAVSVLPENQFCFVTLSAVASRDLLEDWELLVSNSTQ